jgi:hypothetical protein
MCLALIGFMMSIFLLSFFGPETWDRSGERELGCVGFAVFVLGLGLWWFARTPSYRPRLSFSALPATLRYEFVAAFGMYCVAGGLFALTNGGDGPDAAPPIVVGPTAAVLVVTAIALLVGAMALTTHATARFRRVAHEVEDAARKLARSNVRAHHAAPPVAAAPTPPGSEVEIRPAAEAVARVHERDALVRRRASAVERLRAPMRVVVEMKAQTRRDDADVDAQDRLAGARAEADAIQSEIHEIDARVAALGDVDACERASLEARERELAAADPAAAKDLAEIREWTAKTNEALAQINRASESAQRVIAVVRQLAEMTERDGRHNASTIVALADQTNMRLDRLEDDAASVPGLVGHVPRLPVTGAGPIVVGLQSARSVRKWLGDLLERTREQRRELQATIADLEARRRERLLRT